MEEECRRAQEDEKLVILAIYEHEAQFEKNAWKVWKPLSVAIHLEPSDSASRSRALLDSVDLSVNCSVKYPHEVPTITLSNPKGISKEMVRVLHGKLLEKCKELIGTPMILELCSLVRDFLYENSSPVKGSFHDNMVKIQEEKKNEKQRQRLDSEIRDLEQVAAIVKEREQHNLEERQGEQQKPKSFLEDATIRVIAGKTIAVKSSNFAKRQRPHGYCSEWVGVYQNEEVLVSEWNFKFTLGRQNKKKEPDFREFIKKLDDVESYIKQFPALTGLDQTIVPYLFCHTDRRSVEATNMNVTISIGQKVRESEQSLPTIINSIKHEPNICRRLAGHAVCALRWLHEMGFAHGAVTANCFWISDNSFRLSDAGTLSSLLSLSDVFQKCQSGSTVPVGVEEKQSRKKDLFALGTMVDGIRLDQASSNSTAGRDEELTKFITACQGAKSVEELLNMSYLKVDIGAVGSGYSRFGTWQIPDNCRLMNEFITMKLLGSGGFGEVLLARNKVDDSNYAIKRIPLYAKSEKLNRRITREAKLFAKLTHPNVVRYYSAWIENTEKIEASAAKKASPGIKRDKSKTEDSLLPTRLRNLAKNVKSLGGGDTSEWSSLGNGELPSEESSSDEEESNCEKMLFDRGVSEDEDLICFEGTGSQGFSQETEETSTEKSSETPKKEEPSQTPLTVATSELSYPNRLLYIQMEFCGHGTLRSFIDNQALVGNPKTIWRIFREILSGLSYIHRQNMIHRDIKPMNILLDEEDRVKIGDFGLATRDFFRKMDSDSAPLEVNSKVSGQTKDIGTELYMAPELFDTNDPAPYSSKIDVYSTGVVLFEMFYKPLLMGMERLSTLKTLKKSIRFPEDFGQSFPKNQVTMAKNFITRMLQSKAENRPSIEELLEDDRIAVDVDDQLLQSLIQKSLKRGTQAQQNLLNTLLHSEISPSQNYCFDINCCQEKIPNKNLHLAEVQDQLRLILARHCYEPLSTHQLLSAASVQDVVEARQKPVLLLDSKGYPVALPLDLRQNFVRYCCRNDVTRRKRYSLDRVFRSTDGIGLEHPLERWEASVDSLGPVGTATTLTVELISTAAEICTTALPQVDFTLKIGHVGLIVAVCRHLNISDEQTKLVLQKLHELSTNSKVLSLSEKTDIVSAVIGSRSSASLLASLQTEESFSRLRENFKTFTRSRDEAVRDMSQRALSEIEDVHQILEALEVGSKEMRIKFDASLAYRPATFHDGLVFMIDIETQSKKSFNRAIILGGGRYDSSLVRERHPKDNLPKEPLCLVGCSISLDVIIALRKFHKKRCAPTCSTIICSFSEEFTTEKFTLARRLWSKDIATNIIHEPIGNFDDLFDQCVNDGVDHILVVLGKNEVLVNTDGAARKADFDEAVAFCSSEFEDEHEILVAVPLSASRSTSTVCPSANFSNCDVKMAIPDRMTFSVRKRVLNSIRNVPPEAISLFSSKSKIEILVTELSKDLVKNISSAVSRTTTVPELSGIFDSLARQYGKSKEDLECLFSFLKQLLSPRTDSVPIIVLFRHVDGFHKVIT